MQNREQEKLADAILYFIENTKYCYLTKLLKLLYFLDFEHYRETGRSVTGLLYKAWRRGPVSTPLYGSLRHDKQLAGVVRAEYIDAPDLKHNPLAFVPLRKYSGRHLTRREKRILAALAKYFRYTKGEDMISATHEANEPWALTYREKGRDAVIDYDLALASDWLDHEQREEIRERAKEYKENKASLS